MTQEFLKTVKKYYTRCGARTINFFHFHPTARQRHILQKYSLDQLSVGKVHKSLLWLNIIQRQTENMQTGGLLALE